MASGRDRTARTGPGSSAIRRTGEFFSPVRSTPAGSRRLLNACGGVVSEHVTGETKDRRLRKLYALLNDPTVRTEVVDSAAGRYGYPPDHVELRLYVGRFAAPQKGHHEAAIREWAAAQSVGAGPIGVFGLDEVVDRVRAVAAHKQYRDNPVLVTMKVLDAAGLLTTSVPDGEV